MAIKWTEEEIKTADGYAQASDEENAEEHWQYIADMMQDSAGEFPVRTPGAYRTKLYAYWKKKK